MSQQPFIIERTYDAPVSKVWRAITDKEQMKHWYFDIPDFEAQPGAEFSFTGIDNDNKEWVHLCKVVEVVPNKKLAYTWRYEGLSGDSLVTWELFEEGQGSKLRLTHSGLETFPALKAMQKENFERGWTEIVGNLLPAYLKDKS